MTSAAPIDAVHPHTAPRGASLAANILLFQVAWVAGVGGAAAGYAWPGPLAAAIAALLALASSAHRARLAWFLPAVAAVGYAADSGIARLGILEFAAPFPESLPCPLWMAGLWLAFATTLHAALRFLQTRPVLAALFGLIGGPLALRAAVGLGAIRITGDPRLAYAIFAVEYALLTPLLLLAARRALSTSAGSPTETLARSAGRAST